MTFLIKCNYCSSGEFFEKVKDMDCEGTVLYCEACGTYMEIPKDIELIAQ